MLMQKHADISLSRVQNFRSRFLLPRLYPHQVKEEEDGVECYKHLQALLAVDPTSLMVHEVPPTGDQRPPWDHVAALPATEFKAAHMGGTVTTTPLPLSTLIPLTICCSLSGYPCCAVGSSRSHAKTASVLSGPQSGSVSSSRSRPSGRTKRHDHTTVADDAVTRCLADCGNGCFAIQQVHFLWDSSSEAMLYIDGKPMQAFNSAEGADKKGEFVLRKRGQVKVVILPLQSQPG